MYVCMYVCMYIYVYVNVNYIIYLYNELMGQMTDKIKEVYLALKETNTRVARAAAAEAIEKVYI
jgi:hypothetical protein